jgi:3-isopropylmalate/(R)-2-methylmalate dehydratase large subunit
MPKTLAEKLISAHAGRDVKAGELAVVEVDFAYVQDWTGPLTVDMAREIGHGRIHDPARMAVFIDHSSPSSFKDISTGHIKLRAFVAETGCHIFDVGQGISHIVMTEKMTRPNMLILGADSHTCNGGAMGAFATGMGSTDIAAAMVTGKTWMMCPHTTLVVVDGDLPVGVYAKDIILKLIGDVGADGATYQSLEFTGSAIPTLKVPARSTIASMAVEAGGKVGLFETDGNTREWLKLNGRPDDYSELKRDEGAEYIRTVEIDASVLEPQVALPHMVDNVRPITHSDCKDIKVHQAYLGSSTNGNYDDFAAAAEVLKGRSVAPGTRLVITPGTKTVYKKMMDTGLFDIFMDAGGVINSPGCGACPGSHTGILGDGENCIASMNRNFKGRMGNPESSVFLASPATVAASAIEGVIADPRRYL